ncbi:hypothetical protein DUNSADRAFT_16893 [Dunaliella salina]|uniref:Riboflavin kinase n=1 Tax=Dunaliella salina TaxID=3046 RepID=A0ABQ7H959_DUNSA|nr:hypothetical protein DUNSADRAFT_16893 [Dunaliella salina]|eukprot:KAF5843394.1 hypothetical protein DUNSADRAFT_16893 [Dunaliella salina]
MQATTPTSHVGAPPVFELQQLPPNEPVVALTPVQANDVLQALATQGRAPIPQTVDLLDAQNHFLDSMGVKKMAYVHTVELATPNKRFKHNAKASLLQSKQKNKQNRLCDIVQPVLEPGHQGFLDLAYTADGVLIEDSAPVWQFGMQLVKAEGVGKTGLRGLRTPNLHIARIGIFDSSNNHFLGNIIGFKPLHVRNRGTSWEFIPELIVVRCSEMQADPRIGARIIDDSTLSLYVELNVSYRLDIADTKTMPSSEHKASQMVDEITCAWSMISFSRCKEMTQAQSISVPLYYGSIYAPNKLDDLYKAAQKEKAFGGAFKPKKDPHLVFRAGPLPEDPPPVVPYSFCPPTMIAVRSTACALGLYRACLALQAAKQQSVFVPMSDVVLASFEGILADTDLYTEFMSKWRSILAKLAPPPKPCDCKSTPINPSMPTLIEAFRRCVAEISPLLHSQTVPPPHIANFAEYKDYRQKLIHKFCRTVDEDKNVIKGQRHPVEPLSHAGFEYLHEPFDVAEVRLAAGSRCLRS